MSRPTAPSRMTGRALGDFTPLRHGSLMPCGDRKRSTISGIGRLPVLLATLVPKKCLVSTQSGRSCFSICREPQLDPGHHLANQQRWCGEQLAGLANASAAKPRPNHGFCQVICAYPC